jgi:hypothetical protein
LSHTLDICFCQQAGLSPLRLSELLVPRRRLETYVPLADLSPRRVLRVVENVVSMAMNQR